VANTISPVAKSSRIGRPATCSAPVRLPQNLVSTPGTIARRELRVLAAAAPTWDASAASAESSALANGAPARAARPIAGAAAASDAPERAVLGEDVRIRWPGPPALEVLAVAPHESGDGIHAEVTVSLAGVVLSWGG
jgi:hypothetical protein